MACTRRQPPLATRRRRQSTLWRRASSASRPSMPRTPSASCAFRRCRRALCASSRCSSLARSTSSRRRCSSTSGRTSSACRRRLPRCRATLVALAMHSTPFLVWKGGYGLRRAPLARARLGTRRPLPSRALWAVGSARNDRWRRSWRADQRHGGRARQARGHATRRQPGVRVVQQPHAARAGAAVQQGLDRRGDARHASPVQVPPPPKRGARAPAFPSPANAAAGMPLVPVHSADGRLARPAGAQRVADAWFAVGADEVRLAVTVVVTASREAWAVPQHRSRCWAAQARGERARTPSRRAAQ